MPLTRKGAATRQRIVEGAAEQIRAQGVFALRLEDVMAHTATSKSQLFHYFPDGKDELLLAVARHEAARVIDDQQPELGSLTSWAAWQRWRDKVVARYRAQGTDCPLHTALAQLGPATDATRTVAAWPARPVAATAGRGHPPPAGQPARPTPTWTPTARPPPCWPASRAAC